MAPERAHKRVAHRISVQIQSGEQQHATTSADLSLGGMFIDTPVALKERARITLRFSVPTTPNPLIVDAEVRWTEPGGAGVSFLGLRAHEMWALTRFLGASALPADGRMIVR